MPESYFPLVRREPFLVGYWRQNDISGSTQAIDYSSRYGLTGVYASRQLGPALIQSDSGAASSLLTAGSCSIADAAPLRITGDISIEAWFLPYSAGEDANIASKQNSAATFAAPYALALSGGVLTFSLGNGTTQTSISGSAVPVSIPSHVVARCFRGTMTLCVNGEQVAIGSLGAQAVADAGQALVIGKTATLAGVDLIAEVALYDGALSNHRVARHFTIGQQVLSDPAHYWLVDPPVTT